MKSTPTSRRPTGVLAVITLVALVALYVLGARPATPVRLQTRVVTPLGTRGTPVGTVRRQRDRDGGVGGDCGSVLTEDSGHCICCEPLHLPLLPASSDEYPRPHTSSLFPSHNGATLAPLLDYHTLTTVACSPNTHTHTRSLLHTRTQPPHPRRPTVPQSHSPTVRPPPRPLFGCLHPAVRIRPWVDRELRLNSSPRAIPARTLIGLRLAL